MDSYADLIRDLIFKFNFPLIIVHGASALLLLLRDVAALSIVSKSRWLDIFPPLCVVNLACFLSDNLIMAFGGLMV